MEWSQVPNIMMEILWTKLKEYAVRTVVSQRSRLYEYFFQSIVQCTSNTLESCAVYCLEIYIKSMFESFGKTYKQYLIEKNRILAKLIYKIFVGLKDCKTYQSDDSLYVDFFEIKEFTWVNSIGFFVNVQLYVQGNQDFHILLSKTNAPIEKEDFSYEFGE